MELFNFLARPRLCIDFSQTDPAHLVNRFVRVLDIGLRGVARHIVRGSYGRVLRDLLFLFIEIKPRRSVTFLEIGTEDIILASCGVPPCRRSREIIAIELIESLERFEKLRFVAKTPYCNDGKWTMALDGHDTVSMHDLVNPLPKRRGGLFEFWTDVFSVATVVTPGVC